MAVHVRTDTQVYRETIVEKPCKGLHRQLSWVMAFKAVGRTDMIDAIMRAMAEEPAGLRARGAAW